MKKFVALLMAGVILFATACGESTLVEKEGSTDASVSIEETNTHTENTISEAEVSAEPGIAEEDQTAKYLKIYKADLDKAFNLIITGGTVGFGNSEWDGMYGIWEALLYRDIREGLENVGYEIRDISGDGIPELLIGETNGTQYYVIFTCANDKSVYVIGGWDRSTLSLLEGNRLFSSMSAGAAYSAFADMKLSTDGTTFEYNDFYFSDEVEDVNGEYVAKYYRNTSGEWDASVSEALDFDSEKFFSLETDMMTEQLTHSITPFSQYREITPEGTPNANITAEWITREDSYSYNWSYYDSYDSEAPVFIVKTDVTVTDVTFKHLQLDSVTDDGKAVFLEEDLVTTSLIAGDPIVITCLFPGDTPNFGFSYRDSDGTEKKCTISVSGMDGSLVIAEY